MSCFPPPFLPLACAAFAERVYSRVLNSTQSGNRRTFQACRSEGEAMALEEEAEGRDGRRKRSMLDHQLARREGVSSDTSSEHPKSCLEALRSCAGPPDTSRHPSG